MLVEQKSFFSSRELLKCHKSFPIFVLEENLSINKHCSHQKRISFCELFWCCLQFLISINPVNSGSCVRGPIVASELRDFWVLPSLQILQPIIHDEFRQGKTGITSTIFLCFISFISVHFVQSTIIISSYYLAFISLSFVFHIMFKPSKKRPLASCSLLLRPEGALIQRTLSLGRAILKDTNLPFGSVSTSVTSSKPG